VLDRSRSSVLTVGCWWQCGLVSHTTLVTGVSRRQGIGFAIARRLLREDGARVFAHSFVPYDATEPWGGIDQPDQEPHLLTPNSRNVTDPPRS